MEELDTVRESQLTRKGFAEDGYEVPKLTYTFLVQSLLDSD